MKSIIKSIFIVSLCIVLSFLIYVSDFYRASQNAIDLSQNFVQENNVYELKPNSLSTKGIIFYPGALVEVESYLPFLSKLANEGYHIFLVEMPFNLAFFGVNSANDIIVNNPNIDSWTLAGHSLGGAMASSFSSDNDELVDNLILIGAYTYGDYSLAKTLTLIGDQDALAFEDVDYEENVKVINGGNHAGFAEYGIQEGDGPLLLSTQQYQDILIDEIKLFLK